MKSVIKKCIFILKLVVVIKFVNFYKLIYNPEIGIDHSGQKAART